MKLNRIYNIIVNDIIVSTMNGYYTRYSWITTAESEIKEFVSEEEAKEYLDEE